MNIRKLLSEAAALLEASGCDAPRLDAELLLMHISGLQRTDLIIRAFDEIPTETETLFRSLLDRRARREPLAYIIGDKEFWSRDFRVTADVLIPRPETEHLIEAVLEQLPDRSGDYRFCDIGTGSGCIAVTLACKFPQAQIVATDVSEAALAIARQNAARHGVDDRIIFRLDDMLAALTEEDAPFDAVISNPPYVAHHEMEGLEAELSHEPRGALTDEADGLRFLTIILNDGCRHLKPGGLIIVETGPCGLPETPAGLTLAEEVRDLAGHMRGGIYRKA